jgi:hypothetical protein
MAYNNATDADGDGTVRDIKYLDMTDENISSILEG